MCEMEQEATPLLKSENESSEKVVPLKDRFNVSLEEFKIEIKNLPDCYTKNDFCEMLKKTLKLDSTKLEIERDGSSLFVYFCSDEARNNAIEILNGFEWKGKTLEATRANSVDKKRKENFEESKPTKKIKIERDSQEEQLKDAIIPLWNLPYNEQLKWKFEEAKKLLKKLNTKLLHENPRLKNYLNKQNSKFEGLPCELLDIRYSDKCDGYRNHCFFTIEIDEETQLPTVGYMFRGQTRRVGSIESLKHIPESMKIAVKLFQDYVRVSNLRFFNFINFRHLRVRTAENQIMLIVGIHLQILSEAKLQEFKNSLIYYFTKEAGKQANITSLYYEKILKKVERAEHLWGDTHISETLLGLNFKILPDTFFYDNTKCAEILYNSVIELVSAENSTIFEIYCSDATGLCLAKNCKKLLSIRTTPKAVSEATRNIKLNKIENCEIFEGKIEDILRLFCYKVEDDVIAVVNPPTASLEQNAVVQIKNFKKIEKLVYVSNNPEVSLKNFIEFGLLNSENYNNGSFVPEKAVVVDMLPHTKQYEMIISFKRVIPERKAVPLIKSVSESSEKKAPCKDKPFVIKFENENSEDGSDFSSEQFKIEIKNLPDLDRIRDFRRLMNIRFKLDSIKMEFEKNRSSGFVYFRSEEARNKAVETLNGFLFRGSTLEATIPDLDNKSKENSKEEPKENSEEEPKERIIKKQEAAPLVKLEDENSEETASLEDKSNFSLGHFKIELKNLPHLKRIYALRNLINITLKLDSSEVEVEKNSSSAFIYFRSYEARNKAIKKLNGFKWNGKTLEAIRVDCLDKKRKGNFEECGPSKKIKIDKNSQEKQLRNDVTPLWYMPYKEQLKRKFQEAKRFMRKYNGELLRQNPRLNKYLNKQNYEFEGLPCELLDIRYSDKCDGYRNHCAFTVGINKETQLPTVGYYFKNPSRGVASIECLKDIPDSIKLTVKLFQNYVRSSDLKVYYPSTKSGHFRRLTVRTAENQVMLIVGIHPQDLSHEKLQKFKDSLIYYFTEGAGKEAKITSLYYEKIFKKSDGVEYLWGDTHISQTLFGLKLKISPETSFQLNTKVAEIIHKSIIELLPQENSTILCCGSGTTGLSLAKNCKKVLNIDDVHQSIIDATENAKLNKIENCKFFEGKSKMVLESVCNRAKGDIVAVIDPPKVCIQKKAVVKIRNSSQIQQVLYVFMNPKGAFRNLIDFGRPNSRKFCVSNEPFVAEKAIVVDMFPYTNDFGMIISLKRVTVEKKRKVVSLLEFENKSSDKKELKGSSNFSLEKVKIEIENQPSSYSNQEFKWKESTVDVVKVESIPDTEPNKKIKIDKNSQEKELKDVLIPFWNVPYEVQLRNKFEEAKKFLRKLNNELRCQNSNLKDYLDKQNSQYGGLPCELLPIRYAECDGYRNKCKFFVGIDEKTKLPIVGLNLGEKTRKVISIESLNHIPDSMKLAVKLFENYVRNSDLKVFNYETNSGHFRHLIVRTAENQVMLIVGIHLQNFSEEKLQEFKDSLIYYFTVGPGKEAKITSLHYQKVIKRTEYLWGDTHIYETLHGLKFKITPKRPFLCNTKSAEISYKSINELASAENSTILCFGSSTTGLCLAKNCKQVIGIRNVSPVNAEIEEEIQLNQIKNCDFFYGKNEDILKSVYSMMEGDIVAVLAPLANGLPTEIVSQIKNFNKIERLVYMSSDLEVDLKNFINFGQSISETLDNEPFVPEKAVVVDILPHTKEYELIISFKRLKKQEADPLIKSKNEVKALRNFPSEQFKIEIKNLPDCYTKNDFQKLLNRYLQLDSKQIETPIKFNSPFAFVYFSSNEAMNKAIEVLNGYEWNTKILQANRVDCEGESNYDHFRQEDQLKKALIPFWNVPYQRQLRCKFEEVKKFLKELGKVLIRGNSDLREYIDNQKSVYEGFPCELLHIKYAEEFEGYRNHCSFTIGIDKETLLPIVGLKFWYCCREERIGSIESLNHLPDSMKLSVKLFQDYVRNSELKVFNSEANSGHFRRLTVRTAENQVMLIVGIHPQDLPKKKLEEFKNSLIQYFTEGMGKEAKITSLYYEKIVKRITCEEVSGAEHLWGETHISETLCGLKFRISPEMSFQLNTKAAEILYKSVIELSQAKNSTILDICCDNSIGLCFAKNCKEVLSIKNELQPILDAKENAKLNEIENIEFVLGKTEDILWKVCQRAEGDVIAVVSPSGGVLGQGIIEKIRNVNQIGQILYFSSTPKGAVKNFVEFVQPISDKEPFLPEKVIVVDMFPHTNRYELGISFKRFDKL